MNLAFPATDGTICATATVGTIAMRAEFVCNKVGILIVWEGTFVFALDDHNQADLPGVILDARPALTAEI
jgi:hypothetical protein